MNAAQKQELIAAATTLFENIKADIRNASTRAEHIRLTALAQEAAHLLTQVQTLQVDTGDQTMYTWHNDETISKTEDGVQP